ncbi:MAG: D-alanyl-D-alanine carboxypeptidase/D-alanyl-D-alanine-endopeptidase [Actinobacteria bacterium 13_1_20CM_3_71_11]|nr:MAG: D-alanyl-D-alanine carboxypeptidase/D-alanyl-D-alanine-endopeptidase [Actinobacteria bacterium 13_1_20CM_3_71_11]
MRLWFALGAGVVVLALVAGAVFVLRPAALFGPVAASSPTASATPVPAPSPVLGAAPTDAPVPAADAVAGALRGPLADQRLGSHVAVQVTDVLSGQSLYTQNATDGAIPASTMKLVTAVAVLATRGPAYQLQTKAVAGPNPGEVVLVGGGDPTLAVNATGTYPDAARLDDLATQVKKALGGTAPTRVIVDSSLFTGPNTGPNWESDVADGFGYTSRITALMVDGGRTNPKQVDDPSPRTSTPDLFAGQAFAKLLGVSSAVGTGKAPAGGSATPSAAASNAGGPAPGTQLGVVSSPPLMRLLEEMLRTSDNTIAEVLARQVALAKNQPASFAAAGTAVTAVLGELGLPTGGIRTADGSGLSFDDRLSAQLLTGILGLAARPDQAKLHGLFTGLPVAGYSGTLANRYRTPAANPAGGVLRAKTGTLPGVNALAGYVVDSKGRLLAFAVLADRVTAGIIPAEVALDRVGAALAAL